VTDKAPVSLVVITYNEEKNIERCLRAAQFCAELIVVDSGSTDRTADIARSLGAKVIHRDWTGYGDQKNFGTAQASQKWVLCIDADEEVSPAMRDRIMEAFVTDPRCDAFEINRRNFYGGKAICHSGWYPQWKMFLYKRDRVTWDDAEPHPLPVLKNGRKSRLRGGDLYHYTYSGIRQHIEKNLAFAIGSAAAMHRKGRKASAFDLVIRGGWAFIRTYILQRGFLDGFYGLVIATLAAWYTFTKYAMLRELNLRASLDINSDRAS
jgi:glycosyltransferase involved in cell wall biosynthesis